MLVYTDWYGDYIYAEIIILQRNAEVNTKARISYDAGIKQEPDTNGKRRGNASWKGHHMEGSH